MSSRPSGLSTSDRFHFTTLRASTCDLPAVRPGESRQPYRQPCEGLRGVTCKLGPLRACTTADPIRPHLQAKNAGPVLSRERAFYYDNAWLFFLLWDTLATVIVSAVGDPEPLGEIFATSFTPDPSKGWVDQTPGETRPWAFNRRDLRASWEWSVQTRRDVLWGPPGERDNGGRWKGSRRWPVRASGGPGRTRGCTVRWSPHVGREPAPGDVSARYWRLTASRRNAATSRWGARKAVTASFHESLSRGVPGAVKLPQQRVHTSKPTGSRRQPDTPHRPRGTRPQGRPHKMAAAHAPLSARPARAEVA